jgi:hypothetical protein
VSAERSLNSGYIFNAIAAKARPWTTKSSTIYGQSTASVALNR